MALGTYSELQASIASWLHRTNLTTQIPDFIVLAEKRIKTMLTARMQGTVSTIATVAGTVTASLPSTLLRIHSLSIANVMPSIDYLSPEQFHEQFSAGESGAPRCYTIIGDLVYFGPTPDAAYSVSCACQVEIAALSDAAPINALLTKWPNVYLYGAMVEATDYIRDVVENEKWEGKFQAAIMGVNLLDWHTGGPLRVRSDVRM